MQTTATGPRMADRRILIGALILGAVAAGLVVAFLSSQGNEPTVPVADTVRSVVVASEEIPEGTIIAENMLEVREVPLDAVVTGAATDVASLVGQTARFPVAAGEQIHPLRLVPAVEVQALSFQIPPGMRGDTIPVSTENSPASLIAPGDFVDVLVAGVATSLVTQDTVNNGQPVVVELGDQGEEVLGAATLLQNVQVLSVQRLFVTTGQYEPSTRGAPSEDDNVSNVTLALTPEQSQLVLLASQTGTLTLTLRAFGDDNVAPIGAVVGPIPVPVQQQLPNQ